MDYREILKIIADGYRKILKDNLIGIYIHGSIAFGCFNPKKSDIDFLVVIRRELSLEEKMQLLQVLLELESSVPPKGLEMSVVLRRYCRNFVYPTPFELHFSNAHRDRCKNDLKKYCMEMYGTDKDLAAHFTVTKAVGYPLCGERIEDVFGEVPKEDYLDSIFSDVENAQGEILENPVYIILNLCRVYAFLEEGLVLSKAGGGMWGLAKLPSTYAPVIKAAMEEYENSEGYGLEKGILAKEELLKDFAEFMMGLMKPAIGRQSLE